MSENIGRWKAFHHSHPGSLTFWLEAITRPTIPNTPNVGDSDHSPNVAVTIVVVVVVVSAKGMTQQFADQK